MAKIEIVSIGETFEMSFGTEAGEYGVLNIKTVKSKVVVSRPDDDSYVQVKINGQNSIRMKFGDVDTPTSTTNSELYTAIAALI